jgi:hypothetical protein
MTYFNAIDQFDQLCDTDLICFGLPLVDRFEIHCA